MVNALELVGKKIEEVKVVFNGAGAAGIACANLMISMGVNKNNLVLCDSKGVIYQGRTEGMNPYKERLAAQTNDRTLEDVMKGADIFFGVSVKGALTADMLRTMAKDPIVFAMANPDPEITPDEAKSVRGDVIIGTGRSDYNNQVNNVLCFPFLFRGALDTHASAINEEMKLAAVHALAQLAKEDVPDSVRRAYGNSDITFGREYLLPKPFDPRVLLHMAPAVAQAAMDSGVARRPIPDMAKYVEHLEALQGRSKEIMRTMINKAKAEPKRVVFPEGKEDKILRSVQVLLDEKIAIPILIGDEKVIREKAKGLNIDLRDTEIINPRNSDKLDAYTDILFKKRQRKGLTRYDARRRLQKNSNYFGAIMVEQGDADALLSGINAHYPDVISPAIEVIGKKDGLSKVHGLYMMVFKKKVIFCADTTVTIEPTAEELAETAILAAEHAQHFDVTPRVAMLSFSNFGSAYHPLPQKVKKATALVKERVPELTVDGEIQANVALDPDIVKNQYPFSDLKGNANVFIFPDLQSGNITYKMLAKLGNAVAVGPILMGMKKPIHVLQRADDVADIVNMAAVAVNDAQMNELIE
jgi:malate dehydrogenase (oxaloacetate-decarboxylating)(NADP+)